MVTALALGCLYAPTAPQRVEEAPLTSISAADRFQFAAMALGDAVDVTFRSDGCFHHLQTDLVLTRKDSGLSIRMVGATPDLGGTMRLAVRSSLSNDEMQRLDRALAYYRASTPGGCTTVARITVRPRTGEHRGEAEVFVDGSCGGFEKERMPTFGSLLLTESDSSKSSER